MADQSTVLSVVSSRQSSFDTPTSVRKPTLRDTLCPLQTRFDCKGKDSSFVLKRWRAALYTRYVLCLRKSGLYDIEWRDTDHYDTDISCCDSLLDCSTPHLPDELGKTFVQVHETRQDKRVKLITVTLFYHARRPNRKLTEPRTNRTGSCLIQGSKKSVWVKTEFHALAAFVQQLQTGTANLADNVPTDPAAIGETDTSTSPVVIPPDAPSAPASPSLLLAVGMGDTPVTPVLDKPPLMGLVAEHCNRKGSTDGKACVSLIACPPTTDHQAFDQAATQLPQSPQASPPMSDQNSNDPSNCLTPTVREPTTAGDDNSLAAMLAHSPLHPAGISNCDECHPTQQSALLRDPIPPQPCNRAPVSCTDEGSQATELVISGSCFASPTLATQLQSQMDSTHAVAKSLRQEMYRLAAEVEKAVRRVDQLDCDVRDNAVGAFNALKVSESCLADKLAGLNDQLNSLKEKHQGSLDSIRRLTSAKDSHGRELRDLKSFTERLDNRPPAMNWCPVSGEKQAEPSNNANGLTLAHTAAHSLHDSDAINAGPGRSTVLSPPQPAPRRSIGGVSTSTAPRRRNHVDDSNPIMPPSTHTSSADQAKDDRSRPSAIPPREHILNRSVHADTTTVVVGDSVLQHVNGKRMATYEGEKVQVISVSGLQAPHLVDWCQQLPESPHVTLLTFHVGVNDCKGREVTASTWEQVIDSCMRAFPAAQLQASSIVPALGNQFLNNAIHASNANLYHVAKRRGITFLDNAEVFRTARGLPRKALYRDSGRGKKDPIHPSMEGTRRLATFIKRGGQVGVHGDADRKSGENVAKQLYSQAVTGPPRSDHEAVTSAGQSQTPAAITNPPDQPQQRQQPHEQEYHQQQQQHHDAEGLQQHLQQQIQLLALQKLLQRAAPLVSSSLQAGLEQRHLIQHPMQHTVFPTSVWNQRLHPISCQAPEIHPTAAVVQQPGYSTASPLTNGQLQNVVYIPPGQYTQTVYG